jgi:hypothetical protein
MIENNFFGSKTIYWPKRLFMQFDFVGPEDQYLVDPSEMTSKDAPSRAR